ncbi:MAG: aminotransferase class V-fold PLP-dependent enzyme, partial [Spirochaetales bacterium]
VVLVSARGHYSVEKIARILGIGNHNVIKIPVDTENRIDIDRMRQVCAQIREQNERSDEKTKIIAIIGIAGTTETGNIDDLVELRRIADENDTFFHVDAAWGGALLIVDKYRHLFRGIDQADSVTFDAHKLMYSPLSMGMILFRNETALNYIKHTSNYIIRPDSVDQGRFTVEGSRPFSCLKPWVTFKIFGKEGFRILFDHAFDITETLRDIVTRHPDFEPMNVPDIFIFNYRYVPRKIQARLDALMLEIGDESDPYRLIKLLKKLRRINDALNDLTIELHRAVRQEDNSFVSRTMIESTRYSPQKIVVLRAVTINPLTTPEILKEIVDEQSALGARIYQSEFVDILEKL